jgi:hypothetical protein
LAVCGIDDMKFMERSRKRTFLGRVSKSAGTVRRPQFRSERKRIARSV